MLGRGLLAIPACWANCAAARAWTKPPYAPSTTNYLAGNQQVLSCERPVLHKMKELWFYMHALFAGCDAYLKPLRKAAHLRDYEAVVAQIFANCAARPGRRVSGMTFCRTFNILQILFQKSDKILKSPVRFLLPSASNSQKGGGHHGAFIQSGF